MSKKIILVISSVICFILSFSNIYARKLEIKANYDDDYVTFYTVVKASKGSELRFGNNQYGKYIQVSSGDLGQKPDSYDIMGIIFHKEELSHYGGNEGIKPISYETDYITLDNSQYKYNYSNWGTEQNYNVVYVDNYNDKINLTGDETSDKKEIEKYLNYFDGDFFKITNKSNVNQNSINKDRSREIKNNSGEVIGKIFYIGQGDYFENPQYTLVQAGSEVSVVYKYQVDIELFKDGGELEELFFEKNETSKKIHVSFVTKTGETGYMYTAAQFYENIFRGKSFKDSIEKLKLETKIEQLKQQKDNIKNQKDEIDNKISKLPDGPQKSEMIKSSEALKRLYDNINMEIISANNQMLTFGNKHSIEKGTIFAPYTKGIDEGGTPQRGWATANDYDNILVLENDKDKTLYVNYLEENTDSKELSVLYVAPKEEEIYHKLTMYTKGIYYRSLKDFVKEGYVIPNVTYEYEEYKLPVEKIANNYANSNDVTFYYMSEEELNNKLEIDYDSEEEQYKIKYTNKFKFLEDNMDYEKLKDSIISGEKGETSTGQYYGKALSNTKPFLISFIYKRGKKKNIEVEVQHYSKTDGKYLPIAYDGKEYGNEYYEKQKKQPSRNEDKYVTYYKGDPEAENAYTLLKRFNYVDEDENSYVYDKYVSVTLYRGSTEVLTKSYKAADGKMMFSVADLSNSGFTKINITYIYKTSKDPEYEDDTEFDPCPTLTFRSDYSSESAECEDSNNNYGYNPECATDSVLSSSSKNGKNILYMPTEKEFAANINAPKYYINEDFGIIQKITIVPQTIMIPYYKEIAKIKTNGQCTASGFAASDKNGDGIVGPGEGDPWKCENTIRTLDGYEYYTAEELKELEKAIKEMTDRIKAPDIWLGDIGIDYTGTVSDYTNTWSVGGLGSHAHTGTATSTIKYKKFTTFQVSIEVVGFKSKYLGDILFGNISDMKNINLNEPTKFIGNDNTSVLKDASQVLLDNGSKYKLEIIEKIKQKYTGVGNITECNSESEGEKCRGWQTKNWTFVKSNGEKDTREVALLYDYYGQLAQGIAASIYPYNPQPLYDINKTAAEGAAAILGGLSADGTTFNGERLSIAKLIYYDYSWNTTLEGATEINGSYIYSRYGNKLAFDKASVLDYVNKTNTDGKTEKKLVYKEQTVTNPEIDEYVNNACGNDNWKNIKIENYLEVPKEESNGEHYNGSNNIAPSKYQSEEQCRDDKMAEYLGVSQQELRDKYNLGSYGSIWNAYQSKKTSFDFSSNTTELNPNQSIVEQIKLETYEASGDYEVVEGTVYTEKYTNSAGINIMNPAKLEDIYVSGTRQLVSQVIDQKDTTFTLQVGAKTTIIPKITSSEIYTNLTLQDYKNYIGYYVYEFNFPVEYKGTKYEPHTPVVVKVNTNNRQNPYNVVVDDESLYNEQKYDFGGAIEIKPVGKANNGKNYITSEVMIEEDTVWCTAVTKNVPSTVDISNYYKQYISPIDKGQLEANKIIGIYPLLCNLDKTTPATTNNKGMTQLENAGARIRYDSRYFSNIKTLSTVNLSRLYGFRVTDCTDVNYKNIFRVNEGGVNKHTGIVYFTGIRKLDVYSNEYSQNDNTIPLGPYKHTNNTYAEAPKLGYRISFDLKTSGYYSPQHKDLAPRTVVIFPRLYYISKSGDIIKDVDAYYKNSTGKYVKIDQEKDVNNSKKYIDVAQTEGKLPYSGYEITYIPNDGYRNVLNQGITNRDDWFTKEQRTLNMSAIKLTTDMMCTNDDGFIQSWYGEYKLPNSTILVKKGETNLNNNLKNGYCGVVFYIGVVETRKNLGAGKNNADDIVMSYNTSDKKATNQMNTTQWDYEGFLGFPKQNIGVTLNSELSIRLANKTFKFKDQDTYNIVKGTVILYDLDNRAASDFD